VEQALDHHIKQQDQIDQHTFCVGCGEKVYLNDQGSYESYPGGVICMPCIEAQRATDAAAYDAAQMKFEQWQEHWTVRDGELVTA